MASHHHHNPTLAAAATATATTCYCNSYYTPYTPCHHHTQLPPDPHHPPPHHHLYSNQPPSDPHHRPPPQQHLYSDQPNLQQYEPHFEERIFEGERKTQTTISSLIRRIAALESVLLLRRSSTSSSHSLRDAAARIIQTHFRAFLLRRSRTLRQLKNLASIKSTLTILKSLVSEKTHFDYDIIYHKAIGLLLKLDVIQGGDPMIRDGKRSITRELNKLLDLIGGFRVERVNVSYRMTKVKPRGSNREGKLGNVKHGGMKRADEEKLRGLLERTDKLAEELGEVTEGPIIRKHGVTKNRSGVLVDQSGSAKPKVNKSVSFAENGEVYRVLRRNFEPFLDEDCDDSIEIGHFVDARELKDDQCREIEEIGVSSKEAVDSDDEEARLEDRDSHSSGDSEEYTKSCSKKLR